MWTIARFNWPFYGGALLVLIAASWGMILDVEPVIQWACMVAVMGSLYFLIVSLWVSHMVYDLSDLYHWVWLERALGGVERGRMIFSHSGFDEASQELKTRLENVEWVVLDHYDATLMTEASIRRARRLFPPSAGTRSAAFDQWPVVDESVEVIFGLLAIHELRSEEERVAWFAEAYRCLKSGGRVVLAEHTRDLANFFAFGPGFLHFHSCASWQRCWEKAQLHGTDRFQVTPWVQIFVISKP
jgi:hypothetical protein